MRCPKCGSKNQDEALNCEQCGADLQQAAAKDDTIVFLCPHCGTENYDTATECKSCHKQIHSPFVYCTACGRRNAASESACKDCGAPLPAPEKAPAGPEGPALPESARCPSCGNPMEKGFVAAPNKDSFRGVRWAGYEAPMWLYAGEPVQMGDLVVSTLNIPAFRCPACRLVVMRY